MSSQFDWLHGFVLHRRDYRETSAIVDFFCLEFGRVAAVARGVRSAKSTKKAYLQPFQPLQFSLTGRAELKNLGKLEASDNALVLKGQAMFCGMYLNEIINRVMPKEMPAVELFKAYLVALTQLAEQHDQEIVLREFEFALLQELGQSPDWCYEGISGRPISPSVNYVFNPDIGFTEQLIAGTGAANSQQQIFAGEALLEVAAGNWSAQSKLAAKVVNRRLLQPLLGTKPLKSRDLFVRRSPNLQQSEVSKN